MANIALRDKKGFSQQLFLASDLARALVLQAIRNTAEQIRAQATRDAPQATGALKAEIQTVYFGERLVAQIRALPDYAIAQEMGYHGATVFGIKGQRRKIILSGGRGNTGHKFPLSRGLISWAKSKGLPPFAVAQQIHAKGYKPHKFLFGATEAAKKDFIRGVMSILKKDLKARGSA